MSQSLRRPLCFVNGKNWGRKNVPLTVQDQSSHAASPLLPEVWEAMRPFCFERAGNPASSHRAGRLARQALEDAREQSASLLDARPDEVLFTSGATEANNLAIFGCTRLENGQLAKACH